MRHCVRRSVYIDEDYKVKLVNKEKTYDWHDKLRNTKPQLRLKKISSKKQNIERKIDRLVKRD